jgi:hypothetical protein
MCSTAVRLPAPAAGPEVGDFYLAETSIDPTTRETIWHFSNPLAGVDSVAGGQPAEPSDAG